MKYETIRRYFSNMPPLQHYPQKDEGVPFRWEDSEVIQWALSNTRVLNRIFESMRESGAIIYDPETATWRGYMVSKPCSNSPKKPCSESGLKKVKTLGSKLFNFEHDAELKNPLPISTIWGRGIIYEHQQSPYPFALKTGILSAEQNRKTEVPHE